MTHGRMLLLAITLLASGGALAQQAPIPDAPFKTVHLMKVAPAQEAALQAAVNDFNREFAAQGCTTCAYRLFKTVTASDPSFSYLMTADWPGGADYRKIHMSDGFAAVTKRNPIVTELGATEFYGRYVDVK